VLVVDDEPVNRDILSKYLSSDGHTVVTSVNAQEAMERFQAEPFDLIVTDHAMPGMSGLQLAADMRLIRASQPIILVTGFSDPTTCASGEMPEHVNVVLSKPVPQSELRRAVADACAPAGVSPAAPEPGSAASAAPVMEANPEISKTVCHNEFHPALAAASLPTEGALVAPEANLAISKPIPRMEPNLLATKACDPSDGALIAPGLP
jgi:CheY-like chemotaxis protein